MVVVEWAWRNALHLEKTPKKKLVFCSAHVSTSPNGFRFRHSPQKICVCTDWGSEGHDRVTVIWKWNVFLDGALWIIIFLLNNQLDSCSFDREPDFTVQTGRAIRCIHPPTQAEIMTEIWIAFNTSDAPDNFQPWITSIGSIKMPRQMSALGSTQIMNGFICFDRIRSGKLTVDTLDRYCAKLNHWALF